MIPRIPRVTPARETGGGARGILLVAATTHLTDAGYAAVTGATFDIPRLVGTGISGLLLWAILSGISAVASRWEVKRRAPRMKNEVRP